MNFRYVVLTLPFTYHNFRLRSRDYVLHHPTRYATYLLRSLRYSFISDFLRFYVRFCVSATTDFARRLHRLYLCRTHVTCYRGWFTSRYASRSIYAAAILHYTARYTSACLPRTACTLPVALRRTRARSGFLAPCRPLPHLGFHVHTPRYCALFVTHTASPLPHHHLFGSLPVPFTAYTLVRYIPHRLHFTRSFTLRSHARLLPLPHYPPLPPPRFSPPRLHYRHFISGYAFPLQIPFWLPVVGHFTFVGFTHRISLLDTLLDFHVHTYRPVTRFDRLLRSLDVYVCRLDRYDYWTVMTLRLPLFPCYLFPRYIRLR